MTLFYFSSSISGNLKRRLKALLKNEIRSRCVVVSSFQNLQPPYHRIGQTVACFQSYIKRILISTPPRVKKSSERCRDNPFPNEAIRPGSLLCYSTARAARFAGPAGGLESVGLSAPGILLFTPGTVIEAEDGSGLLNSRPRELVNCVPYNRYCYTFSCRSLLCYQ